MTSVFNYMKSDEAIFNDIVDGVVESVRCTMEGVQHAQEYKT